jgi:hypothetical protein
MRFLLLLLLASCASEQVVYKPVEISIPIAVECKIEALPVPTWPMLSLNEKIGLFDAVKAFISELELRKGYEAQLEAAVKSCQ